MDVGSRRIGLALSDPSGTLATPLGFIERKAIQSDIAAIVRRASEYQVERVLVGMPLTVRGQKGRQAQEVEKFCEALREGMDLEVATWDERYSTVEAESRLRQAGRKPSRDRGRTDAAAAAIILQSYLDSMRHQ
ncbi:MAG: Holliday junction resolvase RuvX [Chloroflexi bacterium]|nr:Holliday junction resolvase RuvX [Chloroflexota bacterium]